MTTMPRSESGSTLATRKAPHRVVDAKLLSTLGLPASYLAKSCVLCGGDSLSLSPFEGDAQNDAVAWLPLDAWNLGTKDKPRGSVHRLCNFIFVSGGFSASYGTLDSYCMACKSESSLNGEFMDSRTKFINMKNDNPSLRLRNKECLVPQRLLTLRKGLTQKMKAPKMHFMELNAYVAIHGQPAKTLVKSRQFKGKSIKGVYCQRPEDVGVYELEEEEFQGIDETTSFQFDEHGLRKAEAVDAAITSSKEQARKAISTGNIVDDGDVFMLDTVAVLAKAVQSDKGARLVNATKAAATSDQAALHIGAPDDAAEEHGLLSQESVASTDSCVQTNFMNSMISSITKGSSGSRSETGQPKHKSKKPSSRTTKPTATASTSKLSRSPGAKRPIASTPGGDNRSPSGKGKKTTEQMETEDADFAEEVQIKLAAFVDVSCMPNNEPDLMKFCNDKLDSGNVVVQMVGEKKKSIKRRKTQEASALGDLMDEASETAANYMKIFRELAAASPNAEALDAAMRSEQTSGISFSTAAHLKRWKALCVENLRYNKYDEIAQMLAEDSELSDCFSQNADTTENDEVSDGLALIVTQLVQKLLASSQPRAIALDSMPIRSLKQLVDTLLAHELAVGQSVVQQLTYLQTALKCEDKASLPQDVLRAVGAIRNCPEDQILLRSLVALPHCNPLLLAVEQVCAKRQQSASFLDKISNIKDKLADMVETGVNSEAGVQALKGFLDQLPPLRKILAKNPANQHHMGIIENHAKQAVQKAVEWHCKTELGPYLLSCIVSHDSHVGVQLPPAWQFTCMRSTLKLNSAKCEDHTMFLFFGC